LEPGTGSFDVDAFKVGDLSGGWPRDMLLDLEVHDRIDTHPSVRVG
jgi:hypothetical protein